MRDACVKSNAPRSVPERTKRRASPLLAGLADTSRCCNSAASANHCLANAHVPTEPNKAAAALA
jgi:hypothetical protein